jgi:uncharacterized protein (DUF1800 family)
MLQIRRGPVLGTLVLFLGAAAWAQTTRVYQEGAQGGTFGDTRATYYRLSNTPAQQETYETQQLWVGGDRMNPALGYSSILDFPNLFGSQVGQIPYGAQIVSARLELFVTQLDGNESVRGITASLVSDLTGRGTWHEPTVPNNSLNQGVNYVGRDTRPFTDARWVTPGGDFWTLPGTFTTVGVQLGRVNIFVPFDVTTQVQLWALGLANEGWIVRSDSASLTYFTSDLHAVPTQRPRLTITYNAGAVFNRPPVCTDMNVGATQNTPLPVILGGSDPDGNPLTFTVRKRTEHGRLEGSAPFLTYYPDDGYVGPDTFTFVAFDGYAASNIATANLNVAADPNVVTLTFQEGNLGGANAATRSCYWTVSTNQSSWTTFEDLTLLVGNTRRAILDFPSLIGGGAGQVPPTATVISAVLELKSTVPTLPTGAVTLSRVIDPLARGTWFEPAAQGSGLNLGVSHGARDGRVGQNILWQALGGDFTTAGQTPMVAGSGDATWRAWDVTSAVRAWVAGAPNQGWIANSTSNTNFSFGSDRATDVTTRPRLTVRYLAAPPAGNVPPVALAGLDRSVTEGQLTGLDGSGSYDVNGDPLGYYWLQTAGPPVALSNPASATPTFTAPQVTAAVRLDFVLVVVDASLFSLDVISITVNDTPNNPPTANAGPDQNVQENVLVTLAGSGADPELQPVTFLWTQTAGPEATLSSRTIAGPTFTAPLVSATTILTFSFTVNDGVRATTDTMNVTVTNNPALPNFAPVANAGPDFTTVSGLQTTVTALLSRDPEGGTLAYAWQQTAGSPVVPLSSANAMTAVFTAPVVGGPTQLTFRVTVTDPGTLSANDSVIVTVLPPPSEFVGDDTLNPYRDQLTEAEARHLYRRAGWGYSPGQVTAAVANGLNTTVIGLMTFVPTPALDAEANLVLPPLLPPDVYARAELSEAQTWWHTHILKSPNQLKERMAYFLHDLWATGGVTLLTNEYHWRVKHVDLLRNSALGNWRQFAIDMTKDEMMLEWLDGFTNTVTGPNENYSREFWELFTLGVNQYTEQDVREAARAFTGYQKTTNGTSGSRYQTFNNSRHDNTNKTIFGIVQNFNDVGVIDLTLTRPAARTFLATKLLQFFIRSDPTPAQVTDLANFIVANNWSLNAAVNRILRSNAMFSAAARKSLVKGPLEVAAGFYRLTGMNIDLTRNLLASLNTLGHAVINPPNVAGWEEGEPWLGEFPLIGRAGLIQSYASNRAIQVGLDFSPILPLPGQRTAENTVRTLAGHMDVQFTQEEFLLMVQYLNTRSSGTTVITQPFNGDLAADLDMKFRGLLVLMSMHRHFQLN